MIKRDGDTVATVSEKRFRLRESLTRTTVKSEAVAVFRKLGVASRSNAIEHAVQIGLLERSIYPPSLGLALRG
jgi:hypothetical protein